MRTLLQDIQDFLAVHPEVSPATLGRAALKDSFFVQGLRSGRSPREKTAIRVRAWMAKYEREKRSREVSTRGARKRVAEMARAVEAQRGASDTA